MHIALRDLQYRDPDGVIRKARPGDEIHGFLTWPQVNQEAVLRRGTVKLLAEGDSLPAPAARAAPLPAPGGMQDDDFASDYATPDEGIAFDDEVMQSPVDDRIVGADSNLLPPRRVEYGSVDSPLPPIVEMPIPPPVTEADIDEAAALKEAVHAAFVCDDCDGREFKTKGALGIHRSRAHR